ncbi:MAG TPA: TRAP transporter small permease [Thiolinea sp.]|nr:TRAP transporter small permease [Thiolinea sp.]
MSPAILKVAHSLERAYMLLGALLLVAMSGLMFTDVIGRYFLNKPVRGAFDLVEALMALCAFWFLPLLSRDDQHISVTLLRACSGLVAKIQQALIELICLTVALLMAYGLFETALEYHQIQENSLILGLPKAPFVMICALVVFLMALAHLSRLIRVLTREESKS